MSVQTTASDTAGHCRASMMQPTVLAALCGVCLMLFAGVAPAQTAAAGWISVRVHTGDGLASLFQRAGLPAGAWRQVLKLAPAARVLKTLYPNDKLRVLKTRQGQIVALQYKGRHGRSLSLSLAADGWQKTKRPGPGEKAYTVRISGHIRRSLIAAAKHAGATAKRATALARIFHWRVDLDKGIQPGDRFSLIYRRFYQGKRQLGAGPIIAAEISAGGRLITAFRYQDKHARSAYYDAEGRSLRPAILRTPLNYQRVSSAFSLHRLDPVTHRWRPHYGVDLAASTGTPVKAAANGRIKFIGREHGYGRLIILKNFGDFSTRYAHLHRFASGLHPGSFVSQGQVIGYVGASGEATGPHLHFEVRRDGKPENPLTAKLPATAPLPSTELAAFTRAMRPMMAALNAPSRREDTRVAGQSPTSALTSGAHHCTLLSNLPPTIAFAPQRRGVWPVACHP